MAVTSSYSTLLTNIATWLSRGDLTADIPTMVQAWEERFFRQPRNYGPWMTTTTLSVAFTTTAAVPADFLAARILYINGQVQKPLVVSSLEQLLLAYPRAGSTGTPKWIARDGAAFIFGPAPSGSYTLNGSYYAKPAPLRTYATGGADAVAHFLIVNAPDLLLYGALVEAESFTKNDNRIALWQTKYSESLSDYRDLMKAQGFSGGAMQTLVA